MEGSHCVRLQNIIWCYCQRESYVRWNYLWEMMWRFIQQLCELLLCGVGDLFKGRWYKTYLVRDLMRFPASHTVFICLVSIWSYISCGNWAYVCRVRCFRLMVHEKAERTRMCHRHSLICWVLLRYWSPITLTMVCWKEEYAFEGKLCVCVYVGAHMPGWSWTDEGHGPAYRVQVFEINMQGG